MDEKEKSKLKKLVKELGSIKGRHTELVTVYIPSGFNIYDMASTLKNEQNTASNIKSKSVRKNVVSALEKIVAQLGFYRKTPENGLALFCGNVSEREGVDDIRLWVIEPPEPLRAKLYWCSQQFDMGPLEELVGEKEVYGIICLDSREGDVALLKGKKIESLVHMESMVPGKTRAGGQCLAADTRVLDDSKWIPIGHIGEKITSLDLNTSSAFSSPIIDKWSVKKRAYRIKTENTEIVCSKDHLFFLEGNTTKAAEDLSSRDNLLRFDNGKILPGKILSVEKTSKVIPMVDISVANENFIANGLIVHNSSVRFAHVREGLKQDWFKRIAEAANKVFMEHKEIIGVIISGSGPTKEEFLREELLFADVKKKIIGTVNTSYTGSFGLEETVERGAELLKEASITKEKNLLARFLTELQKPHGLAVYGLEPTLKAMRNGQLDHMIFSEGAPIKEVEFECGHRAVVPGSARPELCPEENTVKHIVREHDASEALDLLTANYGTKMTLVSSDTKEGQQFLALGGIGGFLRFRA